MTLNILSPAPRLDFLKASVKVLDLIWWVNVSFLPPIDRIEKKEFFNDAVNNNIDLEASIQDWAKRNVRAARQGK
jgi:hypothetical protein